MSATRDAGPESGWARLSGRIVYDPDWLSCSAHARLVFVTAIALAKNTRADGEFSLRAMIGVQYGALDPAETVAAIVQLVDCELLENVTTDVYRVRSFLKWNESEDAQRERRRGKQVGAHKTNHGKGYHADNPEPACPLCTDSTPGHDAGHAERDAPADAPVHASARSDGDGDQTETKPPPPPPVTPETGAQAVEVAVVVDDPPAADPTADPMARVVAVADEMVTRAGHLDQPAGPDLVGYVGRALDRGWPAQDLLDAGTEVGAMDPAEIDKTALHVLRGAAKRMANTDPPPERAERPAGPEIDLDFSDLTGLPADPADEINERHNRLTGKGAST